MIRVCLSGLLEEGKYVGAKIAIPGFQIHFADISMWPSDSNLAEHVRVRP